MEERLPPGARQGTREGGLVLNRWLQIFLTIIAGTVVAVIVWNVLERFQHVLILLLASFVLVYLLGPLVDRIERTGMRRILAILLLYLGILGALTLGVVLLIGPLTGQLEGLITTLPTFVGEGSGVVSGIDRFFSEHGIALDLATLSNRLLETLTGAGSALLNSTLAIVVGLVSFVTDLSLILVITFYLLLDGRAMHNRILHLLPTTTRDRWFFIEATLNRVLGGYIRGQVLVSLTVGTAAGLGSALLGVEFPLVIGLLAFFFEFIPLIGPVLGMVPAVIISLFQSPTLTLWVIIYFIALQQVESNFIVPRVTGHAVGLHPLAALLALIAGVDLGGLAGALVAVPVTGVLYVIALALYSDITKQTELIVPKPRRSAYSSLRIPFARRDRQSADGPAPAMPLPMAGAMQSPRAPEATEPPDGTALQPATLEPTVPNERLATITQEQAQLIERFDTNEVEQGAQSPPHEG